jgi:hypothetical protein
MTLCYVVSIEFHKLVQFFYYSNGRKNLDLGLVGLKVIKV